ncbi:MAG TPA: tetratricopeptide repeat protein [Coleofasciculaceae cyanobacterium]|jgi:tetratricopeptide (TPR) repeat protein
MSQHFKPIQILITGLAVVLIALLPGCGQGTGGSNSANAQLERAKKLIENGNFEQAFMELNQALAMAPQDPNVHLNLGWLYLYTDEPEHADQELKKAEELSPDMAEAYHLRGSLLSYHSQKEQNPDKARKLQEDAMQNYRKCLERDDKSYQTYFDLASSQASVGKYEEALGTLDKGFEHIPANDLETQVNFQMSSCADNAALGLYEEAVADCKQALEFTNNPASRDRISEMIENMRLMNPTAVSGNEVNRVTPQGAMHSSEEDALIDDAASD